MRKLIVCMIDLIIWWILAALAKLVLIVTNEKNAGPRTSTGASSATQK